MEFDHISVSSLLRKCDCFSPLHVRIAMKKGHANKQSITVSGCSDGIMMTLVFPGSEAKRSYYYNKNPICVHDNWKYAQIDVQSCSLHAWNCFWLKQAPNNFGSKPSIEDLNVVLNRNIFHVFREISNYFYFK